MVIKSLGVMFALVLAFVALGTRTAEASHLRIGARAQTVSAVNLRSGPGTGYSVYTTIPGKASVYVLEYASDHWYKIRYDGIVGYSYGAFLTQGDLNEGNITSGRASKTPWSGWWWPQLNTYPHHLYDRPGPIEKYDLVMGTAANKWEYDRHRTTERKNDWWGHCQAWSAAAVMEPQPRGRYAYGVWFSEDDIEGLYSETWTYWLGLTYGNQYTGGSRQSASYIDVYPADFDRAVRFWIGEMKTPLVMDFTTGKKVWNYPVYWYSRKSVKSGNKEYVTMTVRRAVPVYGYRGTQSKLVTFYYTLQPGTRGMWKNPYGVSIHTHPDYVNHVIGRSDHYGNPYVYPTSVYKLFGPDTDGAAPSESTEGVDGAGGDQMTAAPLLGSVMANDLGWRVGTEWTVLMSEYGGKLLPIWLTHRFRFQVVDVDIAQRAFTVSMRFANPINQPRSAQGDLLTAGYVLRGSTPQLEWVRFHGRGPKLTGRNLRELLGTRLVPLYLPPRPLKGGDPVERDVPQLGVVQGNRVDMGGGEFATFAEGAPWWVRYSKGSYLLYRLEEFTP